MSVLPSTRIYEGTRIPHPVPTILEVDPEKHRLEDILRVNFGPNHPSTHGVLRLVVDLDGETVAGIRAVIGYLHTGFEKNMEHKSWWKSVTYAPRIDYVSFHANELLYVLAIEKLLGIEVPRRVLCGGGGHRFLHSPSLFTKEIFLVESIHPYNFCSFSFTMMMIFASLVNIYINHN